VNIGFYLLIMKLHCWTFYSGCKLYWKHARLKSFTSHTFNVCNCYAC